MVVLVVLIILAHTSFFPLFMQINLFPRLFEVWPTFLQTSPALIDALALEGASRLKIKMQLINKFAHLVDLIGILIFFPGSLQPYRKVLSF